MNKEYGPNELADERGNMRPLYGLKDWSIPSEHVPREESENIAVVRNLVCEDADALAKSEKSYGHSWKNRGGVGAFMMLARKWDRIENQSKKLNYDIFETIIADPSPTGIIDDIRDLRRYLLLVESEMITRGVIKDGSTG